MCCWVRRCWLLLLVGFDCCLAVWLVGTLSVCVWLWMLVVVCHQLALFGDVCCWIVGWCVLLLLVLCVVCWLLCNGCCSLCVVGSRSR